MEKVINLLNDIETKANKILSRASDNKSKLNEESQLKIKNFEDKIKRETETKLESIRAKADKEVEAELLKLKKEQELYLKQLDDNFDSNCEQYASQIFNRILSLT